MLVKSVINFIKKIFGPIDLTKNKPYKAILLFALPIFISNLFQQIYSISDAIIVGQSIPQQFAGINDTNPLSFLVLQFAFGCTAGLSVAISTRFGKKDFESLRKSFAISIIIGFITTILLTVLGLVFVDKLLSFVGLSEVNDPISFNAAKIYIITIFSGTIAQIFYNLIVNTCRSIGDSITPLLFLILSSLINVILDLLSVNFLPTIDLKVFGVAFATIFAQGLSAVLCIIYSLKKYPFLKLHKDDFKIDGKDFLYHLKLGLPLGFQFSILAIGIIVMQNAIVNFDVGVINSTTNEAAHFAQDGYGAACKLQNFLTTPYSALGTAMLSFCAQNLGSGDVDRIKKGFKEGYLIGIITYLIVMTIGLLFTIDGFFLYLFLDSSSITEETIKYGCRYLWVSLPSGFFLFNVYFLRNTIQGLGKSLYPFLAGIGELFARIIASLFIARLVNPTNPKSDISYIGVSFSDPLAWVTATIIMIIPIIYYLRRLEKLKTNKNVTKLEEKTQNNI